MLAMILFGLLLVLWGMAYQGSKGAAVATWSLAWWASFALEVGKLLLAGGFLAAFLRVFQILQIIETALEHFMMSEGFLKIVTDFEGVWAKVTTRLYLNGADMPESDAFFKNVQTTIQQQLYYDKNYYVRNMHHSMRITLDDDSGDIVVENRHEYEVIALDAMPIELRFRFKARDTLSLDSYDFGEEEFDISVLGTGIDCETNVEEVQDGEMVVKVITLSGHEGYCINRSRREKWALSEDPFYEIITRTVCENFTFTCIAPYNDIRTSFIEYGVKDRFVNKMAKQTEQDRPGDQQRELNGIMLPHNGYAIYFEKL